MQLSKAVKLAVILAALPLLNICSHASSAHLERAAPYRFVDLMPAFWQFWDDTAQSAPDERTRLFRSRFVDRYAAVYRFARSGIGDGDLAAFFQRVAKREGALRRESQLLPSRLRREWDRCRRILPDLDAEATIYVLPAPADAVGGWVRLLGSEDVVILGFEALTATASATEWSVAVDHELMHLYHIQRNSEMRDVTDQYFVRRAQPVHLYQLVWLEGLAMYASQVLNPEAKPGEILNGALTESIRHDLPRVSRAAAKPADIHAWPFTTTSSSLHGSSARTRKRCGSVQRLRDGGNECHGFRPKALTVGRLLS
jgi:hypothetical protein